MNKPARGIPQDIFDLLMREHRSEKARARSQAAVKRRLAIKNLKRVM